MLAVEFGLWELSGALPSAVACLQFVALRLVVTRLPLVPNKDLIFVGAGIAAAGMAHVSVTPVATVLVILAAADLILAASVATIRLAAVAAGEWHVRDEPAARHPLFWILAAAAGLRLAGLFWGLPASDGWDDDGFAPRNFLTALALTYKPGSYFTYPPLHAILLALLSLPGIVLALLQAPSSPSSRCDRRIHQAGIMTYLRRDGAAGESGDVAGHHLVQSARWRGWWRAVAPACSPPAPAR